MQVYCLLGDERVMHSKSPAIFETILKRLGIKGAYVPFKVAPEDIGQALQSIKILNIAGANVAVPYKEKVIRHMDILSEGANIIGAINTVIRSGDELKGYNTNAIGFMDALNEAGFDAEGKSALVFGTGGAAKAAVFILNWLRTDTVIVTGRSEHKCHDLVNRFEVETIPFNALTGQPLTAHIVVNATSVSSPKEAPEMAALVGGLKIDGCELLVDLNYGRQDNFWQDLAGRLGAPFMDGLSPLAYQARRTLALWTRVQVPPEEILKVISEIIAA